MLFLLPSSRGQPAVLRVLSRCVSQGVSEHRNAEGQLVLQRLQGGEEAPLQGHSVGEGREVQVSSARPSLRGASRNAGLRSSVFPVSRLSEKVVAGRGQPSQNHPGQHPADEARRGRVPRALLRLQRLPVDLPGPGLPLHGRGRQQQGEDGERCGRHLQER